jgi:hypothetical protein
MTTDWPRSRKSAKAHQASWRISHCTLSCGVDARRAATKHSDARSRQSATVIFIAASPPALNKPQGQTPRHFWPQGIFARACDGFVPIGGEILNLAPAGDAAKKKATVRFANERFQMKRTEAARELSGKASTQCGAVAFYATLACSACALPSPAGRASSLPKFAE